MKNACIVGYGAIGPIHAEAVCRSRLGALYAICDSDPAKLALAAQNYDIRTYGAYSEILQDKAIDVVHICTPHYLHKDMAVQAMLAGKDVVLEKPAAMDSGELEELWAVQQQTGRKVCLMLQNRMNASIQAMKKLSRDPALGKLIGIEGAMTWHRDAAYYRSGAWRGTWAQEGGGLLINQAVHLIDLFSYLGGGIQTVRASISAKYLDDVIEVEDTADALLGMPGGVRGCFYATNAYNGNKPFRLEMQFENALFRYADNRLYKITDTVEVAASDDMDTHGKRVWGTGHQSVIGQFYSSLENGGDYISLEDGINTMRALFAFYASAQAGGKEIKL